MIVSRNEVLDTVLQVPLPQIENSLRNFPNVELEFEVRLAATSPWSALAFCADALSQARLNLISLKYVSDGGLMARLSHGPDSDLPSLHRALTNSTVVKLMGWTTILKPAIYHNTSRLK